MTPMRIWHLRVSRGSVTESNFQHQGNEGLASFPTLSHHPAWDFMNSNTTAVQHALLNIHDIPSPKSIPSHLHPWYWSTSQQPLPNFNAVATARFHRVQWHLFTTHAAMQAINEYQRLRVHCFFKSHHHSTSTIWSPHPHTTNISKSLQPPHPDCVAKQKPH